jgi:sigma-54 dependent transcriptional regulator, acetoin dehydrogenase operon transcriptional activator AcoR
MFNPEHLHIETSFCLIEPSTALAEVRSLADIHRFIVCIQEEVFVIASDEVHYFSGIEAGTAISECIRKFNWKSSRTVKLAQLIESVCSWERPIIIQDEHDEIKGIATAETLIRFITAEHKRIASYLSVLLETVNDAVTAIDHEGRVIFWNSEAERVYAIKKEDIIGRKIGDHFDKDAVMLHKILDEGRTVRQVYHQPTPSKHVLINASPILESNQVIGGIATEKDITRIVHLNEELYSLVPVRIEQERPFSSIVGMGPVFKRSITAAQKFAQTNTPVLLKGESGSGKEMLAQAIHYGGDRKNGPFLSMHCGAMPGGLLETELFGYQGGAFSNAGNPGKAGKLEMADGGTLLLQEIDQMPLDIQLKLMHYLKSGSFKRIGSEEETTVDTRIIATTTGSMQKLMDEGQFLEQLYYRLNVMSVEIPPLRERTEDIPELVQAFIQEFSVQYQKPAPKVDPGVMTVLMNYNWPGNIRELRNAIERMIILGDADRITTELLPESLATLAKTEEVSLSITTVSEDVIEMDEQDLIKEALRKTFGNKSAAAKMLGVSRGTIYNKMKEYGIED